MKKKSPTPREADRQAWIEMTQSPNYASSSILSKEQAKTRTLINIAIITYSGISDANGLFDLWTPLDKMIESQKQTKEQVVAGLKGYVEGGILLLVGNLFKLTAKGTDWVDKFFEVR